MSLIQKTFVPNLLQSPPHGLNVVVLICHVGVLQVNPKAYAFCHAFPLSLVAEYAFFALLDEVLNTVLLYLRLPAYS